MPDYQRDTVKTYLTNYQPSFGAHPTKHKRSLGNNDGEYSRGGRAYPDLSAIGQDVRTYAGGDKDVAHGTSASAPVIAAILTRINEERLARGKSTVGFINPTIRIR
ncbi:hypothetical protein PRZ48_004091 [Zasmidium cellare]|uniref:Peptidase S8/S53 domain-containing protein n=1 Tax=Zasmidium cellare TaxID=395010 RepID=A0ABR0EY84_ZASCE|nr:hypothetical protein PRZ48_004091 [Zasmidium cellare]